MDSLIGTSIGGYTLVSVLGSGGMGTVYLAEDPAIGQQVAIKVVRTDPDSLADIGAITLSAERFKQEARAVASLDHLHILPLYRYGEEKTSDGQCAYIVMQYRSEGSLWDWLRRRAETAFGQPDKLSDASDGSASHSSILPDGVWPLPLAEANEYLGQAASALQYAHDRGIIHRDVKPANFLLRFENGKPVHLLLSDFGLAKLFSSNSATSNILGTPLYMAPEQFEGAVIPESDQYALAVMIYYLLAGRPPFDGEPMRLMNQHLSAPVPPIENFNPALPISVGQALARALAKRPADRYSTIAEFAAAFAQAAQEQKGSISSLRQFISLPTLAQGGPASPYAPTVAQTPLAAPQPTLQPTPQQTPMHPISGGSFLPADTEIGMQQSRQAFAPTESPAWASASPSAPLAPTSPYYQIALPGAPPSAPLPPPPAQKQGMSRRGALGWLLSGAAAAALLGGGGFFIYSKFHTPDRSLSVLQGHTAPVTSVSWSPDGSHLASASCDKTAKIWLTSSGQVTSTYNGHSAAILSVAWGPGGLQLASGGEDRTVQVWDTQAKRQHFFPHLGAQVSSVAWSLDASYILAGTEGSGAHALLLRNDTIAGNIAHLDIHALAFSPDGSYIAVALQSGFVVVYTVQAPHKPVFSNIPTSPALSLAWSPDGTRLAAGFANNTAEVYEFSPGTSKNKAVLRSLPHNGAVNGVAWEPTNSTSSRLATVAGDGTLNIWDIASGADTTYNGYGPAMLSVAWSSGGLATGDANNTVILWQA